MRASGLLCLVFSLLLGAIFGLLAEVITMKDGRVLKGRIVKETPDTIVLDTGGAKIRISRDEVESIRVPDEEKRYRQLVKELPPSNADDHLRFAEWCRKHNLPWLERYHRTMARKLSSKQNRKSTVHSSSSQKTQLKGNPNCPLCKGTGFVICPECKGTGKIKCHVCGGRGRVKVPCPFCKGKGLEICPECRGRGEVFLPNFGWVTCPKCRGTGKAKCRRCHGKGWVLRGCKICGTRGWVPCPRCRGKGKIECPRCSETSRDEEGGDEPRRVDGVGFLRKALVLLKCYREARFRDAPEEQVRILEEWQREFANRETLIQTTVKAFSVTETAIVIAVNIPSSLEEAFLRLSGEPLHSYHCRRTSFEFETTPSRWANPTIGEDVMVRVRLADKDDFKRGVLGTITEVLRCMGKGR